MLGCTPLFLLLFQLAASQLTFLEMLHKVPCSPDCPVDHGILLQGTVDHQLKRMASIMM
jgi:hypothetical protein